MSKLSGKYFPALTQQNRDLGGLAFAQDANGNWGFKIGGADPVIPFKGEMDFDYEHNISIPYIVVAGNPNVLHYYTMTEEDAAYSYLALFAVTAGSVVSIELSGVSGPSIVCNKPGGNYSFALIANPVLNGKVNFRHGGTGDGHVFKLMPFDFHHRRYDNRSCDIFRFCRHPSHGHPHTEIRLANILYRDNNPSSKAPSSAP